MRRWEGEEIEWGNLDCVLPAEHRNHWRSLCARSERENARNFFTYVLKRVVTSHHGLRREVMTLIAYSSLFLPPLCRNT